MNLENRLAQPHTLGLRPKLPEHSHLIDKRGATKVPSGTPKARNGVQGFTAQDAAAGGVPFILDS
jgi:hypothetical protein